MSLPSATTPSPIPVGSPVPVVINADDYALSPGVSRGILTLIEQGRVSATSCMTACPGWPEQAGWLRAVDGRADLGLHLTLTDQTPAGPLPTLAPTGRLPPVGRLIGLSLRGGLAVPAARADIAAEIDRQLDLFETHMGRPPDHVDGHQHVHVLPGIRGVLLDILARRYGGLPPERRPYVRNCAEAPLALWRRGVEPVKAQIIAALSAGLAEAARRRGFASNRSFRGVYGFGAKADFPALMARFLSPAQTGALVMVHPAQIDPLLAGIDPVVESRYIEQDYLAGPAFAALLDRLGLRVARFRAIA